ncbi:MULTISPECIES: AI-2E family transporter [Mesonia]|jgi:predicted PurR-regulated permease PerM|uniref:Putative PurR-regulated permease PerM n=1 Tax=Mesonia algae TaxID=213248 RepID=A0A2W7I8Q7_9FLAO|nr:MULTISPECIES: AI-2E family transporter [Mesonia]PZW42518.1 putative PurR-regulated permease PerM [Mesonia algae]TXK73481.1 AI-2E family transporter [Mesonia sp. K4-1]
MKAKTITLGILRALGIIVAILLFCLFVYKIQSVIVYIAIAAVISLIGRPIVWFLKKRLKIPIKLAVIIVLLMVTAIFIGIIALFVPIIVQQSENLGQIDFDAFKTDLNELNIQVREYLGVEQIDIIQGLRQTSFVRNFDLEVIPNFMNLIFGGLGTALIGVFSIVFISFFLLKDSKLMLNSILVFSNRGDEDRFKRVFEKIKALLSRYFVGLTLQIFVLFVLYSALLMIYEVDNPIAIAFICAFLNIVPYLGPLVAGVLMMLFVISSNLGADFSTIILPKLMYVMAGYGVAQLIDNFINQPLIFGKSVKSHPLEIFLVILIAGLLFNVIGMIVAIPVYTALKVIAKEAFSEYKIVKNLTKDM